MELLGLAEDVLQELKKDRPPLTATEEARILTQVTTRLSEECLTKWEQTGESEELRQCLRNRLVNVLEVLNLSPQDYQQLRQRLLYKAYHYVHDRTQAEDLVGETFMHMIRKQDQFRGDSTYSTWIHSILFNRIMSHRRTAEVSLEALADSQRGSNNSEPYTFLHYLLGRQDDAPESGEEIIVNREKLSKVLDQIPVVLTDRYSCRAINLLFIQQQTYEETAAVLKIRVDHLHKIVSTARRKLRSSSRIRAILED